MNEKINTNYQTEVADAFNKQSAVFDALYQRNAIVEYKRQRVRSHLEKYLPAQANILELNAGTGDDAIYFAEKGYDVHATDIASGMQKQLIIKSEQKNLTAKISTELCSFMQLEQLKHRGPYDAIFSNFAGLNCTPELRKVIQLLPPLLKRNGIATLVIMPPFCLWELALVLRRDFKTAFRRFNSAKGKRTQVEGLPFTCWYYTPSQVAAFGKDYFDVVSTEALCSVVPPSFFTHFPEKYPQLLSCLVQKEKRWCESWPWKNIGDYFIITLRKK